jgi:hypothetical protein
MLLAKVTTIAIRKLENQDYERVSVFGFDSPFDLKLNHSTKLMKEIFKHRVKIKTAA